MDEAMQNHESQSLRSSHCTSMVMECTHNTDSVFGHLSSAQDWTGTAAYEMHDPCIESVKPPSGLLSAKPTTSRSGYRRPVAAAGIVQGAVVGWL
jgi:hypothetical protein